MKQFDKLTWIALSACGVLLALNFYYSSKIEQERLRQEALKPKPVATEVLGTNTAKDLGLAVNSTKEVSLVEETYSWKTQESEIVFTNIGGGIKELHVLNENNVESDIPVALNAQAKLPIGGFFYKGELDQAPVSYKLVESSAQRVAYQAVLPSGLMVTKRFTRLSSEELASDFRVELRIEVTNTSEELIDLGQYQVYVGSLRPLYAREFDNQIGVYAANDKLKFLHSLKFKDKTPIKTIEKEQAELFGVSNQFFTILWEPKVINPLLELTGRGFKVPLDDHGKAFDKKKGVEAYFPLQQQRLAQKDSINYSYNLYIGPKYRETLVEIKESWGKVMNYGWFSLVSIFLNWMMNNFADWYKAVPNYAWGLAIISLTIFIRIILWPLHQKSTRMMKKMAKLQPKIKAIKEKYPNNPNKLNQETMKLYKEYQLNPMGGCLPMFLQIPIFFGYFKMLQSTIELRGESFLWINDLSQPDTLFSFVLPFEIPIIGHYIPINLLPILMAVTMVIQMSLTPASGDKMQRTMMKLMPLMFFAFCYNYAAALALYWTTQNIFSIGQTLLIQKLPEPELKQSNKPQKEGFLAKLARQAEEMQQAQAAQNTTKKPVKKSGKKR